MIQPLITRRTWQVFPGAHHEITDLLLFCRYRCLGSLRCRLILTRHRTARSADYPGSSADPEREDNALPSREGFAQAFRGPQRAKAKHFNGDKRKERRARSEFSV